ncbi:hypothetical protein [Kalamiella sp. sgz302252]|uniref:hypothetical protein n=1 Tax=Pantoea sp. sgz302252 TaxID=3341827 RepID=UPI0036D3E0E2
MSKRIAVACEGPSDFIVIEAALKAVLKVPFVLSRLPGEAILAQTGGGWGGVIKWCYSMAEMAKSGNFTRLADLPGLEGFDAVIIHLDVDVAGMHYQQCGSAIAALAGHAGWLALPCQQPTLTATILSLQQTIASWIAPVILAGPMNLFCLPAQAMEAWLAAAVLPQGHALLSNIELTPNLSSRFKGLPAKLKLTKSNACYRQNAHLVTRNWQAIQLICPQAKAFSAACQQI